jgi:RNA polymerase sigma-70 factor (ECF subfamily)
LPTLTESIAQPVAAFAPADAEQLAARALRVATRTALGVLGDRTAAEDVAQEVAIIALRKASSVRDPLALDAWLHRTAVRAALREAKRSSNRRVAERAAVSQAATNGNGADGARMAGGGARGDGALEAAALLSGLPARQRAALTLRYVHDLDDHAIARALGCRRGTVRSLLSRGLASLRADLPRT